MTRQACILLAALAVAVSLGSAARGAALTVPDAAERCAGLVGVKVPASAFAHPTGEAAITEAALVPADAATGLPEYCRVRGGVAAANPADPQILFQVNLPTVWNAKTVQYGGGGLNGVVIQATGNFAGGGGAVRGALARGYVTYGSDSGHQGADASQLVNPQSFSNYAHESTKRMLDFSRVLVQRYYGQAARRNYIIGGSKGGHEGLQAAQRYAADFDGVVAYYPAAQTAALNIGWNRMWHYSFNTPGGTINAAEQAVLTAAVMKACDGADGAEDGIVSDPVGCERRFDISVIRCPDGADTGDSCLSDVQIAAVKHAAERFTFAYPLPNGITGVGPWPVFYGGDLPTWLGTGEPGSQQAFFRQTARREEALTATGIDETMWRTTIYPRAAIFDASNPNLDSFRARGGKLILVQGTTDMLVPLSMTNGYYDALAARYGEALSSFVRYYVMPGYGHGRGAFTMQWDSLAALDAWVEAGTPPQSPVATDGNEATRGRTRPLCEYPTWPRYRGSGSMADAASFECVRARGPSS